MLSTLQNAGHVDFTMENIHAILIWILKNANTDIDEQLVIVFNSMIEKANVRNYKSNKRVLLDHEWRYNEAKPTHVCLEYRLVMERIGGIGCGTWSYDTGLEERACEFLRDILTVAYNLGFICDTSDWRLYRRDEWRSGQNKVFMFMKNGQHEPLMEVKAFKNGNMHLRMSQQFMLALNVEMGRLKGWITTPAEAVEELGDLEAAQYFNSQVRLGGSNVKMLMAVNE